MKKILLVFIILFVLLFGFLYFSNLAGFNYLRLVYRHPLCANEHIFNFGAKGDPWTSCHAQLAESRNDYKICNFLILSGGNLKSECLNSIAGKTKDVSICSHIPNKDIKGSCYSGMAIAFKDLSYCDKINLPKDVYCYADVKALRGEIDDCFNLPYPGVNDCLSYAAAATLDGKICSKVVSPHPENNDYFFCISNAATFSKNFSLCNFLENNKQKELCFGSSKSNN